MLRMFGLLPPFQWKKMIVPFLVCLIFGPIVWWIADRQPPYVMSNGIVRPNPTRSGQDLEVLWNVKVFRDDCNGWFQRRLVDSHSHVWAFAFMRSNFVRLPPGTYFTHSSFRLAVPDGITPGQVKLITSATFECNPIHKLWPIQVEWPPIVITIEEGKK